MSELTEREVNHFFAQFEQFLSDTSLKEQLRKVQTLALRSLQQDRAREVLAELVRLKLMLKAWANVEIDWLGNDSVREAYEARCESTWQAAFDLVDGSSPDPETEAREQLASRLIDAWIADKSRGNGKIPWAKAIQIVAIVTKQSDEERDRLLHLGDDDGSCEMCGRKDVAAPQTREEIIEAAREVCRHIGYYLHAGEPRLAIHANSYSAAAKAIQRLIRALKQQPSAAHADMVLVPREPTPAIVNAGMGKFFGGQVFKEDARVQSAAKLEVIDAYKAMIAAHVSQDGGSQRGESA